MESSTTNDVAGRYSHEQDNHNNLKTSDGDSDGADDAGGAVGVTESGEKPHVSENLLNGDSKFSVSFFSPLKTLDGSLLKNVKSYLSLTSHHSSN